MSRHCAASLDHLVGAGEERWRHGEAKSLGGFQIDYQFVLVWRLHWKVRRLLALENAINVVCCATVLIEYVGAVGDEAPVFGKQRPGVYGRKPVAVREVRSIS